MIYLIGIEHNDQNGPDKLLRTFERIKPDVITVEVTEQAAHDVEAQRKLLGLIGFKPQQGHLEEIYRIGYQYWVSKEYAEHAGIEIICTQTKPDEKRMLDLWADLICKKEATDKLARYMEMVDSNIEEEIRKHYNPNRKLAHVGEALHVFGDYQNNLLQRITDLKPERINISNASFSETTQYKQ